MAEKKDIKETKAKLETLDEIADVKADLPEVDVAEDSIPASEKSAPKEGAPALTETDADTEDEHPDTKTAKEVAEAAKTEAEAKTTKAGKHSAKAIREAEEEAARLEAKEQHQAEAADDAPKPPKRSVPNPEHAHGKKYRKAAGLVEVGHAYTLDEALDLTRATATTKFDSSVEIHVNLGVDARQADQMVRSNVVLPHGTGKTIRIAVYADGKSAEDAKAAGADTVGTTDLLAQIEKGKLDFDMLVATPAGMATLGKVAKILGPRGLMPNPKSGTVTPDVAKAVKEAKAGKVEFRIDKQAIIHQVIGKVSFEPDHLKANAVAFLSAVLKAKPSSAKGTYVKALAATTSMGPGIKIDSASTISAIATGKK